MIMRMLVNAITALILFLVGLCGCVTGTVTDTWYFILSLVLMVVFTPMIQEEIMET